MKPDNTYYVGYKLRIIILEQRALELRYNHNHDDRGRFTFSSGGGSAPKKVDKSGKSDKIKYEDSSSKRIRITQKAIDSVPDVSAFSSDELNKLVTDKCREILTDLKSDAVGTEETVSIKLSSLESEKRKGGQGDGVVEGIVFDEPYITIHNHPSCKTFSGRDIDLFAYDSQLKAICIVGNDGRVFILHKTTEFNWTKYGIETFFIQGKKDYAESILKEADKYGFKYYQKAN